MTLYQEANAMGILTILGWIIFGAIIGILARFLMPGRQNMGFMMTTLLGIVGSIIGGLITWAFRGAPQGGFDPAGIIMSILGAILVLWIYGSFAKKRLA